jgi:hypothetical protein
MQGFASSPRSIKEIVSKAPPLRIDKNDPRVCIMLPWNGPVRVIKCPPNWPFTPDSKNLSVESLYPYGEMYTYLVVNDNGLYQCPDQHNRHISGCVGDAFICTNFEPNEDEDVDAAMVSLFGKNCWWRNWSRETHSGFPISADVFPRILTNLRFKELFYFSKFMFTLNHGLKKIIDGVNSHNNPRFTSEVKKQLLALHREFDHPEAELTHTTSSIMHPNGQDVVLIKTYAALENFFAQAIEATNKASRNIHGQSKAPILGGFRLSPELVNEMRADNIIHPRLTMKEFGEKFGPMWAALQTRYIDEWQANRDRDVAATPKAPRGAATVEESREGHPPQQTAYGAIPNWRKLQRARELDYDTANTIRKAMYGAIETADVTLSPHGTLPMSPLGAITTDLQTPNGVEFMMPDGTKVTEGVYDACAHSLMTKVERALNWTRYDPGFNDPACEPPSKVDPSPAPVATVEAMAAEASRILDVDFAKPLTETNKQEVIDKLMASPELLKHLTSQFAARNATPSDGGSAAAASILAGADVEERAHAAEREAKRKAERAQHKAIHDAHMEAEQAEAKAKDARRKAQAAASRAERAAAPPRPYTAPRPQPTSSKSAKKAARQAKRNTPQVKLVHEVHTAEQPFREASFDLNQVATHLEAVAAKAKAKVAAMRKLAADASAAHEAAVHVVPAEPTVGSFIGAAVDAAVYTAKAGMRAVGLA